MNQATFVENSEDISLFGSFPYAHPSLIIGDNIPLIQTDLWALGLFIYELVFRKHLYWTPMLESNKFNESFPVILYIQINSAIKKDDIFSTKKMTFLLMILMIIF